jgi:hypothetical protein
MSGDMLGEMKQNGRIGFRRAHLAATLTAQKIKLSLCLIKRYAMKTYGKVEV